MASSAASDQLDAAQHHGGQNGCDETATHQTQVDRNAHGRPSNN